MSLASHIRALRRLRHLTILTTIFGTVASVAYAWGGGGSGRGAFFLSALSAVASALLLPRFFLKVGSAADMLRGDGKVSVRGLEVYPACLVPLWSMLGIPMTLARLGTVVATSADAPDAARRLRHLAWVYGLVLLLGPLVIYPLLGVLGGIVSGMMTTFVLALASHLLITPLESALVAHDVPVLGGVGSAEPVAIKTL